MGKNGRPPSIVTEYWSTRKERRKERQVRRSPLQEAEWGARTPARSQRDQKKISTVERTDTLKKIVQSPSALPRAPLKYSPRTLEETSPGGCASKDEGTISRSDAEIALQTLCNEVAETKETAATEKFLTSKRTKPAENKHTEDSQVDKILSLLSNYTM